MAWTSSLAQALANTGQRLGLPEFGLSERISGSNTQTRPSNTNPGLFGGGGYVSSPIPGGTQVWPVSGGVAQGGPQKGQTVVNNPAPQNTGSTLGTYNPGPSGGGGGGGGGLTPDNFQSYALANGLDINSPQFADLRARAQQGSEASIRAAMGVFEAKKQGLLGRIPGLQQQRDLRIQGLDEGLGLFNTTAEREEGKRLGDLQDVLGQTNDEYTRAERQQRASAQAVARQLRNTFAGAGTLDSTQYRDYQSDASREILQNMGDIRREKAGKVTSNLREQEDIKGYYSEQKLGELKRVNLEKEQTKAQTDDLVNQIMADVSLTDAQKIEAVTDAQARLEARMADLDSQEMTLKQQSQKDQQDFQLRMAELSNKGYSSGYQQTKDSRAALDAATGAIAEQEKRLGRILSAQEQNNIFTLYGVDKEQANVFSGLGGGSASSGLGGIQF